MFKKLKRKWNYYRNPHHRMSLLLESNSYKASKNGFAILAMELYIMAVKLEVVAQDEYKTPID